MDVQVQSASQDGSGGTLLSWTTVATAIACQIDPQGGGIDGRFGGDMLSRRVMIFTEYSGIQNGYRLVLQSGTTNYYRVTGGNQDVPVVPGPIPVYYQWTAERVQEQG